MTRVDESAPKQIHVYDCSFVSQPRNIVNKIKKVVAIGILADQTFVRVRNTKAKVNTPVFVSTRFRTPCLKLQR